MLYNKGPDNIYLINMQELNGTNIWVIHITTMYMVERTIFNCTAFFFLSQTENVHNY